jgi:hypothetical protein
MFKEKIKKAITFDFYIPKPYRTHIFYWLVIANLIIFHNLYDQYKDIAGNLVKSEIRAFSVSRVVKAEDGFQRLKKLRDFDISIGASGSIAERNSNPGNLKFAGQPGATKGDGGFAKFESPEDGYRALIKQIKLDQSRNLTISGFVNKFAPPSENDTKRYIKNLCEGLNIADIDTEALTAVVMKLESGSVIK